jgi:hypothetical protein
MDNDWIVWFNNLDRYYSYGLYANWDRLRQEENRNHGFLGFILLKGIHAQDKFEVAIKAYTPENKDENPEDFVRPFAGWSYVAYEPVLFFDRGTLSTKFMLGFLGDNSRAGEFQNWFHEKIEQETFEGWDNQVKNKVGVNLQLTYYYPVIRKKHWELYTESSLLAGNVFTEVRPNLSLRFGRYRTPNRELLKSRGDQSEFFLSLGASLRYAVYDATVEAGEGFEEYYDLNHMSGVYHATFYYSTGHLVTELGYHYSYGSVEDQTFHNYGTLSLGWLF